MVYEKIYSVHLWRTKVSHNLPVLLPSLKREEKKKMRRRHWLSEVI